MEDAEFREWLQTQEPVWERVRDAPNPRRSGGPRDRWWAFRAPLPSREGWPVVWVYSSLSALRQANRRRERIARVTEEIHELNAKLAEPRCRRRKRTDLAQRVEEILDTNHARNYCVIHGIRPPNPRLSGQWFHDHPAT